MTHSVFSPARFDEPTAGRPLPAGRRLVIEDLDATSDHDAALLSICVAAAPAVGAFAAPIRFK
jgi:hypothetical protein